MSEPYKDPYDFDLEAEPSGVRWLIRRWKEFKVGEGPSPWVRIARFDDQLAAESVLTRLRGRDDE